MLKSPPCFKKSQLLNMRGPGIILFTKIKSPGIRVGDIDHVGIRNEANKNTLKAIANIIANIKKRNQPRMLFMMRLNFTRFTPDFSPQGKGADSEVSPLWRGSGGGVFDSDMFLFRFFHILNYKL
jgi:hypothetical protein